MYKTIINPVNGTELNIYSDEGKEIIHEYTDHYNQLGGGTSQRCSFILLRNYLIN